MLTQPLYTTYKMSTTTKRTTLSSVFDGTDGICLLAWWHYFSDLVAATKNGISKILSSLQNETKE